MKKIQPTTDFFTLAATNEDAAIFVPARGALPAKFNLIDQYQGKVFVPLFEIACLENNPEFQTYWRRRAIVTIRSMIESEFLKALDASIEPKRVISVSGDLNVRHIEKALKTFPVQFPASQIVMNTREANKLKEEMKTDDPIKEPIKVHSSTLCPQNIAYVLPDSEFVGVIVFAETPKTLQVDEFCTKKPHLAKSLKGKKGIVGYVKLGICISPNISVNAKIIRI